MKCFVYVIYFVTFINSFNAQTCADIDFNKSANKSYSITIEEDSNGDFNFLNSNDLIIKNNSSIVILMNEKRFFNNYNIELIADNNEYDLSRVSSNKVCANTIEFRITSGKKVIQIKKINFIK